MESSKHIEHLRYEIEVLKSMIREHDTGHIVTAIQVLEHRINSMQKIREELSVLDSSYPDGTGYWNTK